MEQILTIEEEIQYIAKCFKEWFVTTDEYDDFSGDRNFVLDFPMYGYASLKDGGKVKYKQLESIIDGKKYSEREIEIIPMFTLEWSVSEKCLKGVLGITLKYKNGDTSTKTNRKLQEACLRSAADDRAWGREPSSLDWTRVYQISMDFITPDGNRYNYPITDFTESGNPYYEFKCSLHEGQSLDELIRNGTKIRVSVDMKSNHSLTEPFAVQSTGVVDTIHPVECSPVDFEDRIPVNNFLVDYETLIKMYETYEAVENISRGVDKDLSTFMKQHSDEMVDKLYDECVRLQEVKTDIDRKLKEFREKRSKELEEAQSAASASNQNQQTSPTPNDNQGQKQQAGCGTMVVIGIVLASLGLILM